MGSYVGIDLHRQRSVVVVLNEDGDRVSWRRIDNTPENWRLRSLLPAARGDVALEATWGWYWAADVIAETGARLHLAHPLAIAGYANRRVKNDVADATLLADLLRMGRLPEAWVPPPAVRELREEVRYRHKLTRLRSGLKAQVHQTLGKEGVIPETKGIWWSGGQRWLDELRLADAYTNRIGSLRDLIELYDREIIQSDTRIHMRLKGDPGYEAIQQMPASARSWPRCSSPRSVTSTASPTLGGCARGPGSPPGCASPTPTPVAGTSPNRARGCCGGRRSKPSPGPPATGGSPRSKPESPPAAVTNIGRVAAGRHLLTLVYYGLRDGEIRCLAHPDAA